MRHRPLSHAQYVLINRLAMPIGAFVILIAIGRHSDALLGQYALVMTYYFIMQMLPLLGLTSFVMREVARAPVEAGRYFSSIGLLSMLGCVVVDAACMPLLAFLRYPAEVKQSIAIVGVLIFPGILLFIAEILFMSVHRARPIAMVAIVENVARVALSIVALGLGFGLTALFIVFFSTRLAALLGYLVALRRMGIVQRWERPDRALIARTATLLPSFLGGTVLFAVFSRLDFVVLSIYERVEALGYYAIAYRPFEITTLMLTALLMAIFPWAARMYSRSPKAFRIAARNVILVFAAALAVVSVSGVLLANEYVLLLFARQHPKPVALTQLFMAAVVLSGLDYVASAMLHASDRQQGDTRAMLFGGVAQLVLLFALIPTYGLLGAFAAKVAATSVQLLLKLLLLGHAFGRIVRLSELARIAMIGALLAAGVLAALAAGWPARLAVALALCFVVLPGAAYALGLLQPARMMRYLNRPHPIPSGRT